MTCHSNVPIRSILFKYGFEPNNAGFISCPFHDERTASLKVFDNTNSWYCFGCQEGGDGIELIKKLFNLNYPAAKVRMQHDFNCTISTENIGEEIRQKRLQAEQDRLKRFDRYLAMVKHENRLNERISNETDGRIKSQLMAELEQLQLLMDNERW